MTFVNNSVYEMQNNVTVRSASKSEWVDLQSSVSCLGGWFMLPSGKVVCHITETKLHTDRKTFCQQLGISYSYKALFLIIFLDLTCCKC